MMAAATECRLVSLTRLPLRLGLAAAVLLMVLPHSTIGVLVGVDLGSQFFKAAIVSPGKPFDVVHNQHSKRKTPTAVSFHEKVRTFGDDAIASAARGLKKTPMFFPLELGRNLSLTAAEAGYDWLPKRSYPYSLRVNDSGTLRFDFGGEDGVTIEEAAAHVLDFTGYLAEQAADGNRISEVVITVPSQATMQQRRAMLDAADIAKLPRVQLIHETSAAAIQRGLDLDLSGINGSANTSTVLYYNMGARHAEACVVAYRGATHLGKNTVAMDVLGCGISHELGGHHVDLIIAEEMRAAFGKKKPKLADGLSESVRALRKLEKEAMNLKHVLSANKEANFRVESLYEDTDFSQQVSREVFEGWCEKLFSQVSKPIEKALLVANTTLQEIDTVEMIGGGWRIPKVQSLLSTYLQSQRPNLSPLVLSQHLNGEEAMATGAAFFGANSSVSFRVKNIFFTDIVPHSYAVLLGVLNTSQLNATQLEEGWSRAVELFPAGSKLRAKKTVKLYQCFDISLTLVENGNHISLYDLSGIHEACNGKYVNLSTPVVSLKMELDSSGVVRLESAQAIFDEPYYVEIADEKPAGAAKNATASNETGNQTEEGNATDGTAQAETPDVAEATYWKYAPENGKPIKPRTEPDINAAQQDMQIEHGTVVKVSKEQKGADGVLYLQLAEGGGWLFDNKPGVGTMCTQVTADGTDVNASKPEKKMKLKHRKHKVPLTVLEHFENISPRPLSAEEKEQANLKLATMNSLDEEVRKTDAAKNALEAFVYESRDKLTSDDAYMQVSTEAEREEIGAMFTNTEDWLYEDEAMSGNASVFEKKMEGLAEKVNPIKFRAYELEQRPGLPELVEKVLDYVNMTLTYVQTNMTWVAAKEIEGVQNLTKAFEPWYANVTELQEKRLLTEQPAYTSYDVKVRLERMRSEAVRLTKIKKIDPMPYSDPYGGYGRYGGYGGYDDEKMREFYRKMYANYSNNSNYSDFFKNYYGNYSKGGANDSDYMRSFYEHAARNFSKENASAEKEEL
mmetsp:Transcript_145927/g.254597  ORF Transcript_145927/g.254597 Transcript_145927/m.254597 type:complete len:1018 (-) Transcript_145927:34-3087(-)